MACPDLARGQNVGAESQQENFPAAGKRQFCFVSQGHAPVEPRLCWRAPIPTKKGTCLRQLLSKCLICPTNWQVAAHLDHAAYQLEREDVKYSNTGNPTETEMLDKRKPPSEYLGFFFFSSLNKGNFSTVNGEGKKLHCL